MEGIVPVGGSQDGPAPGQDPGNILQAHQLHVVADQPVEAIGNAVDLKSMMDGRLYHGPDHGVQARAVTSAGKDRQGSPFLFLHWTSPFPGCYSTSHTV